MSFSEHDVADWVETVATLHASTAHDRADEHQAGEAMAMLWSEFGAYDSPPDAVRMLISATEIGYLTALKHIRDGELDADILAWRPSIAEE